MTAGNYAIAGTGENIFTWCNDCSSTDEQVKATQFSKQAFPPEGTIGYVETIVYIGNRPSNTIHRYRVARYTLPPQFGGTKNFIEAQAVDAEAQNAFNALVTFYNIEPVGFQKVFYFQLTTSYGVKSSSLQSFSEAPRTVATLQGVQPIHAVDATYDAGTIAYDVANPGARQVEFLDSLSGRLGTKFNMAMDSLARSSSFFHITDYSSLSRMASVITFTDGSQLTVVLDTSMTVPKLTIDTSSLRDSHHNPIPVTREMVSGAGITEYDFRGPGNPADSERMANQIRELGVPIVVNPGRKIAAMVCSGGFCRVTYHRDSMNP
jgi:hypothetical protein